eukprot:scaffold7572_cov124-Isochrysis_galbana.AAC.5
MSVAKAVWRPTPTLELGRMHGGEGKGGGADTDRGPERPAASLAPPVRCLARASSSRCTRRQSR